LSGGESRAHFSQEPPQHENGIFEFKTDHLPAGFNSAYNWGWEQHPVHKKWDAAFDALVTDSEAELPTEFAGVS
jgi:hypothetical protein